ncbi:MAG: DNA gyrase subunit A [Candidatus Bostrichicola ureolyticus]|nr:MAG: DNA gyrase subunit A [Candidatus Bostrichicola ureolyticus]
MIYKEKIIPINIEDEMKSSYIDYSMSVIISRALPDIRDGLKPVHRRVLFGMYKLGLLYNRTHKKSARIVGEVLGKLHPHGDNSVYDTIVRMAQNWSLRYKLIDGQGNFGSIDNDPPAAMRYTEIRLNKISEEMLVDIEKETVDMQLNFDDSLKEPTVLPTRIPNLLINGVSGIAVGMATNMAPHNLKESIEAIFAFIDNKDIDIDNLMHYIKAPDFPTGGIIYGYEGVKNAFHTGRGSIIIRAKTHFENIDNKECIIVDEIPYQVIKSDLLIKTYTIIKEGKLEGISNIRDESNRKGIRIVYVLKHNVVPDVVLNQLYKYTNLQIFFSINNIALINGKPTKVNLKDIIKYFVNHRIEVVTRRTKYDLQKAEERYHILEGFLITLKNIDIIFKLIKNSKNYNEACNVLMKDFNLSKIQAKSILEVRLHRLTNIERENIKNDYKDCKKIIEKYKDILSQETLRMEIIKNELIEIKKKYSDKRCTKINYLGSQVTMEDLIINEPVILTISNAGYIKRTPLNEYKPQKRGGIGNIGASLRKEDFIEHLLIATTHQYALFFTKKGKCFWIRVFEIPEGHKIYKGRPIQNLINIEPGDKISACILTDDINNKEYVKNHYIIMVTKYGIIKKTLLQQYSIPRKNGINAIKIRNGDFIKKVKIIKKDNSHILIASHNGMILRFSNKKIRTMNRNSYGIKGIKLYNDDFVVGMICINDFENETILIVSEKGFGKRSNIKDYPITNRGCKGVKTIKITKKTGKLIAIDNVLNTQHFMIIKKSGVAIRMLISDIKIMGRATQGIKLINLKSNDDQISSITKI